MTDNERCQARLTEVTCRTHIADLERLNVGNLDNWRSPSNRQVKCLLGIIDRLREQRVAGCLRCGYQSPVRSIEERRANSTD